jgi:hypothetical protein
MTSLYISIQHAKLETHGSYHGEAQAQVDPSGMPEMFL